MAVILLGGDAFTPARIGGLTAWWAADYGVEEANGDPAEDTDEVLNWLDQSGNGRTLTGANDTTKPQYLTNIMNSKPVLRFVAGAFEVRATVADIATLLTNNAKTIFTVVNTNAVSAGIWYADTGAADAIACQTDSSDDLISTNNDGTSDNATKVATSVPLIHTYMHDGTSVYSGVSDTRTASLASTLSGNTAVMTGTFNVGRTRAAFGSFDLAEIVMYNVALSEADRQLVEQYLATRWGITLPY